MSGLLLAEVSEVGGGGPGVGGRLGRREGALIAKYKAGDTAIRNRRSWLLGKSGRVAIVDWRGALVGAAEVGRGDGRRKGRTLLGHGRSWNGSLAVETELRADGDEVEVGGGGSGQGGIVLSMRSVSADAEAQRDLERTPKAAPTALECTRARAVRKEADQRAGSRKACSASSPRWTPLTPSSGKNVHSIIRPSMLSNPKRTSGS